MKDYEICSELIDVLIDVTCIYGIDESGGNLTFDDKSSASISLNQPKIVNSGFSRKLSLQSNQNLILCPF